MAHIHDTFELVKIFIGQVTLAVTGDIGVGPFENLRLQIFRCNLLFQVLFSVQRRSLDETERLRVAAQDVLIQSTLVRPDLW